MRARMIVTMVVVLETLAVIGYASVTRVTLESPVTACVMNTDPVQPTGYVTVDLADIVATCVRITVALATMLIAVVMVAVMVHTSACAILVGLGLVVMKELAPTTVQDMVPV